MKKTLALLLVTLMLVTLAACGPATQTTANNGTTANSTTTTTAAVNTTITYVTLGGTGMATLEQAAKDFKAETGITVVLEDWAYSDAYQKILTMADAGNMPDSMYGFSSWTEQFKIAGYTVALDDLISKELYNDFSEAARGVCTVDGKLWALPSYMSVRTSLFNETAFTNAGVAIPTTWEEFLAAAPKLTDASKAKYAYSLVAGHAKNTLDCFLPFLWAYDAEVLNADRTKSAFNTPEGVAALQMYVDVAKYSVPDYGEATINNTQSNFTSQVAASYFHNAQGIAALKDAGSDFSWVKITPPLAGPKGTRVSLGVMDVDLVFKTGNEAATAKWLEFWHNKDREGLVIEQAGWVPNQTSFYERASFNDASNIMVAPFTALEPIAKFKPSISSWEELQKIMADAITKAVMGDLTAAEAFEIAGKQADELLAKQ